MKSNSLENIISILYKENKKIHIRSVPKYIKIINLMLLEDKIDYTLAYKLNYKIFSSIEPFMCEEEKKC